MVTGGCFLSTAREILSDAFVAAGLPEVCAGSMAGMRDDFSCKFGTGGFLDS